MCGTSGGRCWGDSGLSYLARLLERASRRADSVGRHPSAPDDGGFGVCHCGDHRAGGVTMMCSVDTPCGGQTQEIIHEDPYVRVITIQCANGHTLARYGPPPTVPPHHVNLTGNAAYRPGCRGCGAPIPRGRTVWCSDACQDLHGGSFSRRLAEGRACAGCRIMFQPKGNHRSARYCSRRCAREASRKVLSA